MLTCVCRPVSGNLPKMPPTAVLPVQKPRVVTAEPKINVPGRLTSAELRAMALRQQQQIDSQHQLLATKEQRLRFLKSQEVRHVAANAASEGERLRLSYLRERVEAQECKLRRLRALRGQVDLQKTYNVTLSNDLDSIRALFSEKEKELSLAVAKVEALTRQLEDLKRDRRCPINLLVSGNNGRGGGQPLPTQATRELEKLRRELMYRNQLSLQQDARLHMQREALQQRQAELRSVDQRIYELQTRLQRKRSASTAPQVPPHNMPLLMQQQQQQQQQQKQHQQQLLQQQQTYQQQQQQQQQTQQQQQSQQTYASDNNVAYKTNLAKQGVAALKEQLLQKQASSNMNSGQLLPPSAQPHGPSKFANMIGRGDNRSIARGNVAAVEPYIHTPQKALAGNANAGGFIGTANVLKHAAATANTNQQNQLIQDLSNINLAVSNAPSYFGADKVGGGGESDESKLAKKMLTATLVAGHTKKPAEEPVAHTLKPAEADLSHHIYAEVTPKNKRELVKEAAATTANMEATSSKIPKSIVTTSAASATVALINKLNSNTESGTEREKREKEAATAAASGDKKQQLTVHSQPLGTVNKSLATGVGKVNGASANAAAKASKPSTTGTLAVPPRKPISSVAPTTVSSTSATGSSIPKIIHYAPKVNRVAPNIIAMAPGAADRPALPPKPRPIKVESTESATLEQTAPSTAATMSNNSNSTATTTSMAPTITTSLKKPAIAETPTFGLQSLNINDNLPIKAKPLTIRKQPLSEQPRLKSSTGLGGGSKSSGQNTRKLDMPAASAFLFSNGGGATEENKAASPAMHESNGENEAKRSPAGVSAQYSPNSNSSSGMDEPDRQNDGVSIGTDKENSPDSLKRRYRNGNTGGGGGVGGNGKPKLTRRVSFDPLALLLDASLEGELELVKKTAKQVTNPSAANDEGITALHNAICAGHFDIVKFLVEFGCDVNAQDSDGWTPLHCAASCNNLSMVKFLVESGACLFASTLSDHETPAEKCEEDEEGFDGCSEYLYSIQEKLGILHGGEVYAVFSYEAQNSDELNFNVDDRLIILRKSDDAESEWWWAKNTNHNDQEGYVPRNLLGLYPRVPPQSCNDD